MIFGIAAIQGFALAAILFFNKRGEVFLNKILGLLLFFFSAILVEESLELLSYHSALQRITGFSFLIDLFLGPLTLIYASSLSNRDKPVGIWKHLALPAFLNTVYLPYHFMVGWQEHVINNPLLEDIYLFFVFLKIGYQVVYQVASIIILHKFVIKGNGKAAAKIKMAVFVKYILLTVLVLIPGVIVFEVTQDQLAFDPDYVTSLIMMIAIYSIGYAALGNPIVYTRISEVVEADKTNGERYRTSSLTEEEKKKSTNLLLKYMDDQKPYLDPDLTSDKLADLMKISRHNLSQVLNETLEQNFYDFINHYRVKEFIKQMEEADGQDRNILAIGYKSGFNSKATLNRVFKNITGKTPSNYFRPSH